MEEAGIAARKNLHAKPLKGCIQATQVRGNSANTGISVDTTVKLSVAREQRERVDYRYIIIDMDIDRKGEKCKEKQNQIFIRSLYKQLRFLNTPKLYKGYDDIPNSSEYIRLLKRSSGSCGIFSGNISQMKVINL